MIVNIHQAKTHLSKIITEFLNGEEVIIAKNGKPLLKFTKIDSENSIKKPIGFFNCDIDMTSFEEPVDGLEEYL